MVYCFLCFVIRYWAVLSTHYWTVPLIYIWLILIRIEVWITILVDIVIIIYHCSLFTLSSCSSSNLMSWLYGLGVQLFVCLKWPSSQVSFSLIILRTIRTHVSWVVDWLLASLGLLLLIVLDEAVFNIPRVQAIHEINLNKWLAIFLTYLLMHVHIVGVVHLIFTILDE